MVPGLHIMPISDEDEAFQILNEAQANRAVAEHQLNMKSSRSHVIYTYYITRTKLSDEAASDAEGESNEYILVLDIATFYLLYPHYITFILH